jgi:exodeoxyribonuclease VII large subunit
MQEHTYAIRELTQLIGRALGRVFPDEVWIRGEIRDLSRSKSGHVYFALVDPSDDPRAAPSALLPVTLFESDRDAVNRALLRAGAGRMSDGTEVRIRGRVNHYAARGTVQIRMTWIDTDYTLGRLAAERERLIRTLAGEGLLERNGALPFPVVPLRVGLVTSVGSAAHADFVKELETSGFGFCVTVADARVQGAQAEGSLIAALEAVAAQGVDVLAIVRGGGSASDLAAFDREMVARAVATLPVPVLTGIGHETDETVVDRVAALAFKTPTACATAIVVRVGAFRDSVEILADQIGGAAAARIATAGRTLHVASLHLGRSVRDRMSLASGRLDGTDGRLQRGAMLSTQGDEASLTALADHIARAGRHQLALGVSALGVVGGRVVEGARQALVASRRQVDTAADVVAASDPHRLLARGWSVTRNEAGEVVRSPASVAAGEGLETTVAGGTIMSRVVVSDGGTPPGTSSDEETPT